MTSIFGYENYDKDNVDEELAKIIDNLDKQLQDLVNYGLDADEIAALKIQGERIIDLSKRLRELEVAK
jgi:hypothetical protein